MKIKACTLKTASVLVAFAMAFSMNVASAYAEAAFSEAEFEAVKADCLADCSEVEALIKSCEERNFEVPYEKAYLRMMKLFTEYLDEEYADTAKHYRIEQYDSAIEEYYNIAANSLNSYLDGTAIPKKIPRYDLATAQYDCESGHFYANDDAGTKRPIIYIGCNNFRTPIDDTESGASAFQGYTAELGYNFTAGGIYITQLLGGYDTTTKTFKIQTDEGKNDSSNANDPNAYWRKNKIQIRQLLEECRKSGITVNMLFDTMAAYGSSGDEWVNFKETGKNYSGFIKCNPTHPMMKKQVAAAMTEFVKLIKDYRDVVTSICLTNEPSFQSYDKEFYKPLWQEFLQSKYGTIDILNSKYPAEYASFEDVAMPSEVEYTVLYGDYREFNESITAEFMQYMYDDVKSELKKQGVADMVVYTKQLPTIHTVNSAAHRKRGTNFEKFAEILDINGTDSHAYLSSSYNFHTRLLWYDLLRSVSDTPIADTEMHILYDTAADGNVSYDEREPSWVYANMWQAAVHGADQLALWMHGRDATSQTSFYNASFLLNPKALAASSKAALDIQRLAPELTAVQDAKPTAAVLWSDTSYTHNSDLFNSINVVYKALITKGQRVEFITENTIDKLSEHTVLFVANSRNTTESVLDKITEFSKKNKVVMIGDGCLSNDEYNKAFSSEKTAALTANAEKLDAVSENDKLTLGSGADERISEILRESGKMTIELVDNSTGKAVSNTEWLAADNNGETLINICSYEFNSTKNISVYVNGVRCTKMKELISGETISSAQLNAYSPLLLSLGDGAGYETDEFTFSRGSEALGGITADVTSVSVNVENISTEGGFEPALVLAQYNGGIFEKLYISSAGIEPGNKKALTINDVSLDAGREVKLMLWNRQGLYPLKEEYTANVK